MAKSKEEKLPFAVGQKVWLKSGSPELTVESITTEEVVVTWPDGETIQRATMVPETLQDTRVDADGPPQGKTEAPVQAFGGSEEAPSPVSNRPSCPQCHSHNVGIAGGLRYCHNCTNKGW